MTDTTDIWRGTLALMILPSIRWGHRQLERDLRGWSLTTDILDRFFGRARS